MVLSSGSSCCSKLINQRRVSMTAHRLLRLLVTLSITATVCNSIWAADPPPPLINSFTTANGQKKLNWTPYPAAQQYKIFRADDLSEPWVEDSSGNLSGFDWTAPLAGNLGFYRLQAVPLSSDDLLVATVLNRLAYGPTPDELERVHVLGAGNYIQEQLAPEAIIESLSIDVVNTNS